jgi:hypothetical protein
VFNFCLAECSRFALGESEVQRSTGHVMEGLVAGSERCRAPPLDCFGSTFLGRVLN